MMTVNNRLVLHRIQSHCTIWIKPRTELHIFYLHHFENQTNFNNLLRKIQFEKLLFENVYKMFVYYLFISHSGFHLWFFLFQNASVILFGVRCTKTNLVQYCDISLQCTNAYAWKDAFVQLLRTSWNFQKQNIQMFFTNNPVSNKNWKYVKK